MAVVAVEVAFSAVKASLFQKINLLISVKSVTL